MIRFQDADGQSGNDRLARNRPTGLGERGARPYILSNRPTPQHLFVMGSRSLGAELAPAGADRPPGRQDDEYESHPSQANRPPRYTPRLRMTGDRAIVYTDGSCIGNPGPGGWAVHAELTGGQVVELGGGELDTTNNRMELRAAIEAVRLTRSCPAVTVITDSTYVRGGVTGWLAGWKRNGWRTGTDGPVANQGLWVELDELADERVTWEWTRAHVGTPGNERCDRIARWFAESVAPLDGAARRDPPRRKPTTPGGAAYLSLVDGIVARHATWDACAKRVHGVRGARYRKVRNADEERAIVATWGLRPEALDYP